MIKLTCEPIILNGYFNNVDDFIQWILWFFVRLKTI